MMAQTNSELGRFRRGYKDGIKGHYDHDLRKDPFYREGFREAKLFCVVQKSNGQTVH